MMTRNALEEQGGPPRRWRGMMRPSRPSHNAREPISIAATFCSRAARLMTVAAPISSPLPAIQTMRGAFQPGQPELSRGNFELALQNYQAAVEIKPDFADAFARMANALDNLAAPPKRCGLRSVRCHRSRVMPKFISI